MQEKYNGYNFDKLGFKKRNAPSYTHYQGKIGDCPWTFHAYVPTELGSDSFSNLLAQFESTFKVITSTGVFEVSKSDISLEVADLELGDPGVRQMFPETNEKSTDESDLKLNFQEINKELSRKQNPLHEKIGMLNIQVVNNYLIKIFETKCDIPQKFALVEGRHDDTYAVKLDLETQMQIRGMVEPYFLKIFGYDLPDLVHGLIIGNEEV